DFDGEALFFFFQAEDGIRDFHVTGVQTCALPIWSPVPVPRRAARGVPRLGPPAMPHVVTQACCADASCVHACPVNCIHPTPDEPDFATAEMLYIDPVSCVDCGACVGACPVGAIVPHTALAPDQLDFLGINEALTGDDRPSR